MKFDPKIYWDDRLKKEYNLLGVGDISLTRNYNKWSYKITRIYLKRLINKYLKSDEGVVLDIGSGTGFVIDILLTRFKKIKSIDISKTAVENLKKKYQNFDSVFYELNVGEQKLPFEKDSIKLVTAASVLYHIVHDDQLSFLLKNIHHVLNKDGFFIFSENFIHKSKYDLIHQKVRTLESYEQILKDNGFQIIERSPNYVLFNDPVDSKNAILPKFWHYITILSKKSIFFDSIIWPILFPIELILVRILKESPAQEFMVCKVIK